VAVVVVDGGSRRRGMGLVWWLWSSTTWHGAGVVVVVDVASGWRGHRCCGGRVWHAAGTMVVVDVALGWRGRRGGGGGVIEEVVGSSTWHPAGGEVVLVVEKVAVVVNVAARRRRGGGSRRARRGSRVMWTWQTASSLPTSLGRGEGARWRWWCGRRGWRTSPALLGILPSSVLLSSSSSCSVGVGVARGRRGVFGVLVIVIEAGRHPRLAHNGHSRGLAGSDSEGEGMRGGMVVVGKQGVTCVTWKLSLPKSA
jgi:hypothetical protein